MPRSLLHASSLSWRWLAPVALAIVAFHWAPPGLTLDRVFLDFASRHPLRAPRPPRGSALVLIDEKTMTALAPKGVRWPFQRCYFVALLAALERAGAARVVVDLVFLDPSDRADYDLLLGATAAASPSFVLARTAAKPPAFYTKAFQDEAGVTLPTAILGNVDFQPDSDGVVRHYHAPGSLAAAAFDPPATAPGGLLRWYGGLDEVRAGGVPVLSAGPYLLAGLPLWDRIATQAPGMTAGEVAQVLAAGPRLPGPLADAVRGRVVFVGANAAATFDVKPLPVGNDIEPGVLIHWTAWANLRQRAFVHEAPRAIALAAGLLGAILVGLASRGHHGLLGPGAAAGAIALGCLAGAYAGHSLGWFFPPATPVAAALFSLLGVTAEGFLVERQRKREVQAMFGSYVAPEVVDLLVREPDAIRLGGERRELTALFSDLAGFTDLSERIPPDQLLAIINRYLQEVSDCLLGAGAYIDKYIGDAVMAVFGAPQSLPDHAAAACRGALAAQRMLGRLNEGYQRDYGQTLRMRIGINTGPMIVGNLGSERKRNYTVLGDAVNLASRLEAANKEFGTAILLGETTARRVQREFATRPLTRLRVKGKTEAVEVHELVAETTALTAAQTEFLAAYGAGYAALIGHRFAEASAAFARAGTLRPEDLMTQAWQKEASEYAATPPAPDWRPLLKLESK